MKTQQNVSVESPHNTTDTTNAQMATRSKAEIRAERLTWAIWAAGVYKRASAKEKYQMLNDLVDGES